MTGRLALFTAVCALVVACTNDPTAPSAPLEPGGPSLSTSSVSSTSAAEERALKAREQSEKLRVDALQKVSQAKYDLLKLEWSRLNTRYPKGNPALLYCDPLQYTAQVKVVGPEGADIDFGPHKLRIPKGALATRTVITAEMPVALTVGAVFSPHGLKFAKPASLTLSYKHCNRPSTAAKTIVYVDAALRILERPLSTDVNSTGLVRTDINHFSGYIIAYRNGSSESGAAEEF